MPMRRIGLLLAAIMAVVAQIAVTPAVAGDSAAGACCHGDTCQVTSFDVCFITGGVYQGDGTTCDGNPCDDVNPLGACCVGASCQVIEFDLCTSIGGDWQGEDTDCIDGQCQSSCPGDVTGDNMTNVDDILEVINNFGFLFDVDDLLLVIANFGCVV